MRITRTRAAVALGATAACAAAALGVNAGSAQADGSFTVFHSAGSDTIQAVETALGDSTGVINTAGGAKATIYSYDAVTGNATDGFKTHATAVTASGQTFVRPNGSGEGRLALAYANKNLPWPSTSTTDTTGVSLAGQIDIARSSGKPTTGASDITAVPLARDAFGVAIIQTSAGYTANPIDTLTNAQIHDLYTNAGFDVDGANTGLPANTVDPDGGSASDAVTVVPWLPQSGSGTRGDFISSVLNKITAGNGQSIEPSKTDSALVPVSHQHEENTLAATGAGACSTGNYFCSMLPTNATTAYVIPISAAQWISQLAGAQHSADTTLITGAHTELLAVAPNLDGTGTPAQPYSITGADKHGDTGSAPATAYYAGAWGRDVFNVVPTTKISDPNSTLATYLRLNLTSAAAQSIIASYGFENVPYAGMLYPATTSTTTLAGDGSTPTAVDPAHVDATWGKLGDHVVPGKWETDLPSGNSFGGAKFPYTVSASTVAVAGTPAAGQTLTATGGFTPAATNGYNYAWTDGATPLGTSASLVVPAGEAGRTITLTVTGSQTNSSNATVSIPVTIAATPAAVTPAPKTLKKATPKFTGTVASGKKLTAKAGTWTKGTKFTYAWYIGTVKKSTKSTFTIPKKSKGKIVSLKVTGKLTGYTSVTQTSFAKVVTK
jgi:hypothetical protein